MGFALIAFLVSSMSQGLEPSFLLTEFYKDGALNGQVKFPQLTFCPLWPEGVIQGISCYQSNASIWSTQFQLTGQVMNSTWTSQYPNNKCTAFNFDGKSVADASHTTLCFLNSTNINPQNTSITWDGRVRLYVDPPNTKQFGGCQYCLGGIDGSILVQGYSSFVFWQAHIYELGGEVGRVVEYQTNMNRLPIVPGLDDSNGITLVAGFFTKDVWVSEMVRREKKRKLALLLKKIKTKKNYVSSCI